MKDINWMTAKDIVFDNIPAELKGFRQFVNWELQAQPEGKKPKKPPINPLTGKFASPTDPPTWSDFDTARKAAPEHQGIGFVLVREKGYTIIDIDNCRDPETGELQRWAKRIVHLFMSYTEISPSRRGIKIIIRAEHLKGKQCKISNLPWEHSSDSTIEIYGGERYTTLTGNLYHPVLSTIKARQDKLDKLYEEVNGAQNPKSEETTRESEEATTDLSDEEVIQKAHQRDGDKFRRLFEGCLEEYGSDDSRADFAFCKMLAHHTRDAGQIDRIVRQSALIRDKWDEIHDGSRSYGEMTIAKALRSTRKAEQSTPKLLTISELKSQSEPFTEYIWGEVLPKGGSSFLVAKPKVGKSTVGLNLALRVSRGEPFLGLPTRKTPVWYVALAGETRPCELIAFFDTNGLHEGILIYEGPSLKAIVDTLRGWFEQYATEPLVIIDTLGKAVHVKDLNDYVEVNKEIEPFTELARETHSHIMMLHHAKKNTADDIGDGILGSTALRGAVETNIYLDKKSDYRRIVSEQRWGTPIPETVLMYEPDTRILTAMCEEKAFKEGEIERRIIVVLQDNDKELRQDLLLHQLGGNAQANQKVLFGMIGRGKVMRLGKGGKSDPYIIRLTGENSQAA